MCRIALLSVHKCTPNLLCVSHRVPTLRKVKASIARPRALPSRWTPRALQDWKENSTSKPRRSTAARTALCTARPCVPMKRCRARPDERRMDIANLPTPDPFIRVDPGWIQKRHCVLSSVRPGGCFTTSAPLEALCTIAPVDPCDRGCSWCHALPVAVHHRAGVLAESRGAAWRHRAPWPR